MAANVTFDQLMKGFGVVTVMNACIYVPKKSYTGDFACCEVGGTEPSNSGTVMKPSDFIFSGESIDTLKIANITQEGPTKTVTGGQYGNTLIKYGKTATVEMQDALGRARTLERFFGCDYDGYVEGQAISESVEGVETISFTVSGLTSDNLINIKANGKLATTSGSTGPVYTLGTGGKITFSSGVEAGDFIQVEKTGSRVSIGDKFPGAFAMEGTTFFIDQKTGEKKNVHIFIPQFTPDAILTLTQDAEGDATVFDLNGTANVTSVTNDQGTDGRDIFYEISDKSFFAGSAS